MGEEDSADWYLQKKVGDEMNDIVAKMIIKVYVVSGKEITHMYQDRIRE